MEKLTELTDLTDHRRLRTFRTFELTFLQNFTEYRKFLFDIGFSISLLTVITT